MPETSAVHEYSMLVSPVVLIGLGYGLLLLWKKKIILKKYPMMTIVIFSFSVFQLCFFAQLARGFGWMVTPLESLPVFSGLHVNMRYLYAFSFLPICASVWCLQQWSTSKAVTLGACALTVLAFFFGYTGLLHTDSLPRIMDYAAIEKTLDLYPDFMDTSVETQEVLEDIVAASFLPFIQGSNLVTCEEPMLLGTSTLPRTVYAGSITEETDGYYNVYNPACMVYPDANGCKSGDRILVTDKENLERFRTGKPTTWKMSRLQHIANWLSVMSLAASLVLVALRKQLTVNC